MPYDMEGDGKGKGACVQILYVQNLVVSHTYGTVMFTVKDAKILE
jgi:hypothetical protein